MVQGQVKYFKYYCETEAEWIIEEATIDAAEPTQCKNDPGHTIKSGSIHINGIQNYGLCHMRDLLGDESEAYTTQFNIDTITLPQLAKIVKCIMKCGELRGLINLN